MLECRISAYLVPRHLAEQRSATIHIDLNAGYVTTQVRRQEQTDIGHLSNVTLSLVNRWAAVR